MLSAQQFKKDIQIYEYIVEHEKSLEIRQHPLPSQAALFIHVFLKLAVIIFFYFQDILDYAIGKMLNREIMIFFIILDFWFTKNYNGRRLLGLRWFFSLDRNYNERFFFQTRINDDFVSSMSFMVFWLVQFVYILYPIVYFYVIFHAQIQVQLNQMLALVFQAIMFLGGTLNLFLFYKAYMCSRRKNKQLQMMFGGEFVKKLSKNSLISYL